MQVAAKGESIPTVNIIPLCSAFAQSNTLPGNPGEARTIVLQRPGVTNGKQTTGRDLLIKQVLALSI